MHYMVNSVVCDFKGETFLDTGSIRGLIGLQVVKEECINQPCPRTYIGLLLVNKDGCSRL